MLGCISVTLTHDVHSGLSDLGPAAVGARDLVLPVIRPDGLLDEQSAVLALRLHDYSLFVDFGLILGPLDLWLGSARHYGRKL